MQPSSHTLDRLGVEFDDPHLVANAGLLLPATLAQHLGLREVVEQHLDLGDAPGRANVGPKAMWLIHSMLAGGDSIADTNVVRAGATQGVLGHAVLAPSTLGTFLRSFTVGHVRQLDAVGREMLRPAWEGERGPGARALTIDMDSTICEVFGLLKQGVGSATPRCGATTRCWPPGPTPARCSTPGCGGEQPSQSGEPLGSWPRPSPGCEPPEPPVS